MYHWELKQFIEERDNYLGGDDLLKVISTIENPQLIGIEYKAFENKYYMWDKDGNNYNFTPMTYEEAKHKSLVKKLVNNDKSVYDRKNV